MLAYSTRSILASKMETNFMWSRFAKQLKRIPSQIEFRFEFSRHFGVQLAPQSFKARCQLRWPLSWRSNVFLFGKPMCQWLRGVESSRNVCIKSTMEGIVHCRFDFGKLLDGSLWSGREAKSVSEASFLVLWAWKSWFFIYSISGACKSWSASLSYMHLPLSSIRRRIFAV